MDKEDIIRMAMQAAPISECGWAYRMEKTTPGTLERFAALIAAAEREECAKQLDSLGNDHCAAAIRARGQS